MKKLIILCTVFFTTLSWGQNLTLKSMNQLIDAIDREEFTHKGTGRLFSYISTSSCLYVSENLAIFKNYCFPVRQYPARGYTIISAEFGMIDLYEEKLPVGLKRDITLSEFPEILAPYLTTPFPMATLEGLDAMMEKIHYKYNPGCWSTNLSYYTETKDVNCTIRTDAVSGFEEWSVETQEIVADEETWNLLFNKIEARIKNL